MSKVFFTADLHISHGNIIKYCNRPFLTDLDRKALADLGGAWGRERSDWRITREAVEMMDNTIIDNINDTVGENDILWTLGDFAFIKHDTYNACKKIRDRIRCRTVNHIWGNHDDYSIRSVFNEVHDMSSIWVGKRKVIMCHYAMAIWDKSHHGAYMLYGHSHGTAEPWLDKVMPGRRSMDVGIDNAAKILGYYKPFSFEEIDTILKNKTGVVVDHHE